MTLQAVAKAAGVSPSTVSRVVNGHPRVAPETIKIVNAAIDELQFKPARRGRRPRTARELSYGHVRSHRHAVSLMVVGSSGTDLSPGFEGLMRGVSSAANDLGIELAIHFYSDPGQIDLQAGKGMPDGFLIHGETPCLDAQPMLQRVPCVWLMANRERPSWGDQILPDNSAIGEIAANYLINCGHRHLAICNVDWNSWSMEVRKHAFIRAAESHDAHAAVVDSAAMRAVSQNGKKRSPSAAEVVDELLALAHRPIGLFVAEDRQVMPLYLELQQRGLKIGRDADVDIISCNNQRAHLIGLEPMPATIDIRIETIGYRGVELLLSRLQTSHARERIRTLVDPVLVRPENASR